MNISIITARGGSKSIKNKNIYPVKGKPIIYYPIKASLDATLVEKIYISTDNQEIARVGEENGCQIIWRPEKLCGDEVNHGDVIKHAVEYVDEKVNNLNNVVLLLGNTVMIDGPLIDRALSILDTRKELDSVMTVWEAADDHPLRALQIHNGLLRPFGDQSRSVSTDRQSYPKAYYYDQGIWAFKKACVEKRMGPNPWWWMGKNSFPLIRTWVTGRDVHNMFDVALQEWYIDNIDLLKHLTETEGL